MNLFKLIFSIVLISLSATLFAQTGTDVIYLKNGKKVQGKITEYVVNDFVEINVNGAVLKFTQKEIKRIVADGSSVKKSTNTTSPTDDSATDDMVYLHNGAVVVGQIKDLKRGEFVDILSNGELMHFENAEVRRIVTAVPRVGNNMKKQKTIIDPATLTTKGFYSVAYLSFAYGENLDEDFSLGAGVHAVFGKQFSELKGLGLGLGIDNYRPSRGQTVYPIYLDYRLYPFKKNKAYYLNVGAGYGFAFKNSGRGIVEANGGIYAAPALGYRTASSDGVSLNLELGFKMQKAYFVEESARTMNDIQINDLLYKRISFRLGIMFWNK